MTRAPLRLAALLVVGAPAFGGCGVDETAVPPDPCLGDDPPPAGALACPAPAVVECRGARTPVARDDLGAVSLGADRCGLDAVAAVADDLPEDGVPRGRRAVRFTATTALGGALACVTRVDVVDRTPPVPACPDDFTVVRAAPGAPVAPPPAEATDACDGAGLAAAPDVEDLPAGTTTIRYTARDAARNEARCETRATVLEAFAAPRFRVLGGGLRPRDGADPATDVWLAWEAPAGADAAALRLERATDPDGPFEPVADLDLAQRTYVDEAIPADRVHYRLRTLAGPDGLPGGATEPVTAWAIRGETYDLRDRAVPTVTFDTTLYGVTRWPAAAEGDGVEPRPLVVLLHGNHGICRRVSDSRDFCTLSTDHECGPFEGFVTAPNAEGLAWLAESLAVQGRVAVTISGNAMNCRGGVGGFNPERSQLLVEHLRQWKAWAEDGGAPFGDRFVGRVDLRRVAVFGHSRGGEAVALVPSVLDDTPIDGLVLRSVFALAPVDFTDAQPAGVPYAVLLPTCDGDVSTLVGMQVYDRAFGADAGAPVAQLAMTGANHNFFNTEWFDDDNQTLRRTCPVPTGVDGVAQRALLEGAVGDWLAATLDPPGGPAPPAPWLRADAPVPESVDAWAELDLDVRRAYGAADRILVADGAAAGAPAANGLGAANRFDGFLEAAACDPGGCPGRYAHLRSALSLRWSEPGAVATLGLGGVDARDRDAVVLRMASPGDALNDGREVWGLRVRLRDGRRRSAEVPLSVAEPVPHLYDAFSPFTLLQSVRLPLASFAAVDPGLDLSRLAAIELVFDDAPPDGGALVVTDVTFASDRSTDPVGSP